MPPSSEDWIDEVTLQAGRASAAEMSAAEDEERIVAMLYLPNPEARRGWELHQVLAKRDERKRRKVGF